MEPIEKCWRDMRTNETAAKELAHACACAERRIEKTLVSPDEYWHIRLDGEARRWWRTRTAELARVLRAAKGS